jgi:hypothetical protein
LVSFPCLTPWASILRPPEGGLARRPCGGLVRPLADRRLARNGADGQLTTDNCRVGIVHVPPKPGVRVVRHCPGIRFSSWPLTWNREPGTSPAVRRAPCCPPPSANLAFFALSIERWTSNTERHWASRRAIMASGTGCSFLGRTRQSDLIALRAKGPQRAASGAILRSRSVCGQPSWHGPSCHSNGVKGCSLGLEAMS